MTKELITPKERCATCAFREGTVASKNRLTVLKAQLCLKTGGHFLCHEAPMVLRDSVLCRGYVDALTVTMGRPIEAEWKRLLYSKLLGVIDKYEDDPDNFSDDHFDAEIRNVIQEVGAAVALSGGDLT